MTMKPSLILCTLLFSYAPHIRTLSLPTSYVNRRTRTLRQARYNDAPYGDEEERMPPTHITSGTKIKADMFTSTNPLIIEGELDIKRLECAEEIYVSGKVRGHIKGGVLVTVDGELEGSVECTELVVGPAGMVSGDVYCRDLIIRPGGKIGGQLSCENMKSERDVFHDTKSPLPQVVYQNTPNPRARDSVVAALHAMSDRQTTYEVPLDNVRTDDYGNPLIGGASDEQVLSLRKNREEIFATRSFLNQAMVRKVELPEWAQAVKGASDNPKDATKEIPNDKVTKVVESTVKGKAEASSEDDPAPEAVPPPLAAPPQPKLTNSGKTDVEIPGFLENPYAGVSDYIDVQQQRIVESILKQREVEADDEDDHDYENDLEPDDGYYYDDDVDEEYTDHDDQNDGYIVDDRIPDFLR